MHWQWTMGASSRPRRLSTARAILALAACVSAPIARAQNRPDTLWVRTGFISYVEGVAVSPDGQTLAVAGDVRIDLYRLSDGVCLRTLTGRGSAVGTVAWSPDGSKLVGTGYNGQVWLYRASDGALLAQTKTNTRGDGCTSAAFAPDGQHIATASPYNTTLDIWRASDLGLARRIAAVGAWCVAYSPDGATLAVGCTDGRVRILDLSTGAVVRTLTGHTAKVNDVAFSPDGSTIVSGSADKNGRLWNAATGAPLSTLIGHTWTVDEVAFSPDGAQVATAGWEGSLKVWETSSGALVRTVPAGGAAMAVCFSQDGSRLLGSLKTQQVAEWSIADGSQLREFTTDQWSLHSVAVDPGGTRVAVASGKLQIFGLTDGHLARTLSTYLGWPVGGTAWSPDGTLVYGLGGDTVTSWTAATGDPVGSFSVAEASIQCSAISHDASHVAVCATDGTVAAYNLMTSTRLWGAPSAGASAPHSMAFSRDATLVADIADPGILEVWRVSDGASVLSRTMAPYGWPWCLAFAPSGLEVAVGTNQGYVLLVDLATGGITALLPGTNGKVVFSLVYTPDGSNMIVSSGGDATRIVRRSDGRVLACYAEEMARGMNCADLNAAGTVWCYGRTDSCLVAANMPNLSDPTSLAMPGATGMVGASVNMSATLTSGGAPLAGREVHFWRDQAWWESGYLGSAVTDGSGTARLAYVPGGPAGFQWVYAAYGGADGYQYAEASGLVTVEKPTTKLFTINRSGVIDGVVAFRGYLATVQSTPIVSKTLTFAIDGTNVGTASTDVAGRATLWYTIPSTLSTGLHGLSVSFAGDATFPAASASAALTVARGTASVWVMPRTAPRGALTYLRAIARSVRLGTALTGIGIDYSLDGTALGSATTDSNGRASLSYTIPASLATGDHALDCTFAGNASYEPAAGSGIVTVTP